MATRGLRWCWRLRFDTRALETAAELRADISGEQRIAKQSTRKGGKEQGKGRNMLARVESCLYGFKGRRRTGKRCRRVLSTTGGRTASRKRKRHGGHLWAKTAERNMGTGRNMLDFLWDSALRLQEKVQTHGV